MDYSSGHPNNRRIQGSTMDPADLERQLDELKSSTEHAIKKSWEESERLYEVNAASENRIRELEQKLTQLMTSTGQRQTGESVQGERGGVTKILNGPLGRGGNKNNKLDADDPTIRTADETDLMVGWDDDCSIESCSSLEDESVSPLSPRRQRQRDRRRRRQSQQGGGDSSLLLSDTASRLSHDEIASRTSSSLLTTQSDPTGSKRGMMMKRMGTSFRLSKIRERQRTELEDKLMDQMAEMQQRHQQEMEEAALKLQQREDAIKTLEKALSLQGETVDMLRKELDDVRRSGQATVESSSSVGAPSIGEAQQRDQQARPTGISRREMLKRSASARMVRHGFGGLT